MLQEIGVNLPQSFCEVAGRACSLFGRIHYIIEKAFLKPNLLGFALLSLIGWL
jgi:hypothetical protein